jgi:hypothetical protein
LQVKDLYGKGLTKSEQKAVGKKVAPYAALMVDLVLKSAVKHPKQQLQLRARKSGRAAVAASPKAGPSRPREVFIRLHIR